jgi:polar amino acid transport system substrate-binding protein
MMTIRSPFFRSAVIAVTLTTGALLGAPASSAETLRVCADPDNLPFSKSEGPQRGLYLETAELVGKRLGMQVEYHWWLTYNQRKAIRNTILQDNCDVYFALPAGGDYRARGLKKTQAFMDVSYAVVSAPNFVFEKLSDLKGKRVAVQFSSTPALMMSVQGGYTMSTFRESEEAMDALAKGDVDAAFLWGPVAGFDNRQRFQGRYRVASVRGLDMNGQVAVAVPNGKEALLAKVNEALNDLKPQITALAANYGFPQSTPIQLTAFGRSAPLANQAVVIVGAANGWVNTQSEAAKKPSEPKKSKSKKSKKSEELAEKEAEKAKAEAAKAEPPKPVLSEAGKLGRVRFNDQCSHCHSVDGASPLPERNLRRVQARYDAKWKDTAIATIKNGRIDAGMPAWKDIYGEKEITELMSFIESIQR